MNLFPDKHKLSEFRVTKCSREPSRLKEGMLGDELKLCKKIGILTDVITGAIIDAHFIATTV